MNLKDKLIRKLLDTGKRHRILVYPTLALVAIITAVSHAVYWGRGNGKKLVASVMVMVMLITQSLFLTSSADVGDNDSSNIGTATDAGTSQGNNQTQTLAAPAAQTVNYYRVDEAGNAILAGSGAVTVSGTNPDEYSINIPDDASKAAWCFGDASQAAYFSFTELFKDVACTNAVGGMGIIDDTWEIKDGSYAVYFKATRMKYPVVIMDGANEIYTDIVELTDFAAGNINPSFNYQVKDNTVYSAYKFGYNYSGVSYGGSHYDAGQVVSVAPAADQYSVSMNTDWTGMSFDVTFDAIGDDAPSAISTVGGADEEKIVTYTYGSETTLFSDDDMAAWAGNEAYYLSGWKNDVLSFGAGVAVDVSDLAVNGGDITANPNISGVTLTGVWTYKDIILKVVNTNCAVSIDDSGAVITGTYGDDISCVINAEYKKDNLQGSKFEYFITTEDINKLGTYGLNVTTSSDGSRITSYTISGKLNNVTAENGVSINLQITDKNKPSGEQVSNHTITLVSNKREVTIDSTTVKSDTNDGKPSKAYDGSDEIGVSATAGLLNVVEGDDVKATFNSKAKLDNANAGDNKTITLVNVSLTGDKSGMYTLVGTDEDINNVTIENVAKVLRRPISVSVELKAGNTSSVLFGQASPDYVLRISDVSGLAKNEQDIYNGLSGDDEILSFMRNYIGFVDFGYNRQIYSPAGTYTMTPEFNDQNSNYTVSTTGLSAEFTVGREDAVKDTNYRFSTEPGANGYYPGLTITAAGNYDKIRLLGAGDADITAGMSKSEAEALFESAVVLPDMTNGTITFQMLDTSTGAITNIVTLTGINVDTTAPAYVSHTVSPNITYFNEFNFGSYYHSQMIDGQVVESVNITVSYKSDNSDCDKLYYFFADENGNPKGDLTREVKMTKNAAGNYQAGITIGTGASGQLIVYASDTTGNISGQSKIKLEEAIDFVKNNGDTYYEWMVENTIDSANIDVTDSAGNAASSDGVWYNSLNFKVNAADADSGLNKLMWSITDSSGAVVSEEENAGKNIASIVSITSYGKVTGYTFTHSIGSEGIAVGEYYVGGTLYDNAGNSVELAQVGPYLIDCNAPVIDYVLPDSGEYLSGVVFDFTVTDGEDESGLASVKLYKDSISDESLLKAWGEQDGYTYNITSNGKYIIVATDIAGNVAQREATFTGISDVLPTDPIIKVDEGEGQIGVDGWYIGDKPYITILSEEETTDGVPVTTYYRITTGNKEIEKTVNSEEYKFQLSDEGTVTIEAWSVSASNCKSNTATAVVKVDVDAPDVYISESTVDETGAVTINFKATDEVSGVNLDKIMINGEPVAVEETDGIVTGSFKADGSNTYSITVEDNAGNAAEPIEFTPLNMLVSPVTNITPDSAYIEAEVYQGTNEISDCYIAYKKSSETSYDTCLSNKHSEDYGISMDYKFRNLEPDTVYDYRVYAITKISKEVKVVEGSFRTADSNSTVSIYGNVSYDTDLSEEFKTYPVYVNLYDANVAIAGIQIDDETDMDYIFKNISDGAYRITATNGLLTKEASVVVTNGGISYPDNYASEGGINFVLNGFSTSVVIEDGAINLTADGLDKIYNTELYNGNVTEDDLRVVQDGGTIDISLHASYINVTDVDQTAQSIFADKIGKDAVIERYIQLYIVKEVRDADGNYVNNTPSNITRLAEPITVSFPLGELSGQKIYVASLHGEDADYDFLNWNSTSDIAISKNFVTIMTDRFSVYALYRTVEAPKEYTVKWIDGDGNVMKAETVKHGEAATPPKETPKKTATDKYTYTFTGWDTDYSSITKDTIISAWFKADKIDDGGNKPDDDKTDNKPNDNNNGSGGDKQDDISTSTPSYSYMGSAESPQTGDAAPIVIISVVMLLAAIGMVIIKRKIINKI